MIAAIHCFGRNRIACAIAFVVVLSWAAPALAVDRTLGANVPKPTASGAPWSDAQGAALAANVDVTLAGAATLRGAHIGLYAINASDGRVLYERNADDAFQPASSLKLLVGSVALERLGPDYRFRTTLVANGPVDGGVLRGALILRAGNDPFLNAGDLDAAASAVADAGIRSVAALAVDDGRDSAPGYLPGWTQDDFSYYYAPLVGALAFEENVVHVTVAPGLRAGAPPLVTTVPVAGLPGVVGGCGPTVDVQVVDDATTALAGTTDTIDVHRESSGCIHVVGSIPVGGAPDQLDAAVSSPDAYAVQALTAALARHGVQVPASDPLAQPWPAAAEHRIVPPQLPQAKVLWVHDSEPLRDVLADMWFPSDNLVAEMLLREVAVAVDGIPGTSANGVAIEQAWLTTLGLDASGLTLVDGSGLSVYDRITPRDMVTILQHDWNAPSRDLILDDLPIAAVRGTLKDDFERDSPTAGHLFAKSGSLMHVRTMAGYAANATHGTVIFAFDVDDWVGDAAALADVRAHVLAHFVTD
jgi:D-alanyl-D-alanine carboxypeptidase/D-alanyl-D-alanine-endopeptidase (penicillin-binding protein 4)